MSTTGFFSPSEIVSTGRVELGLVAKCGACGLYKKCRSPKMKVYGRGKKEILVVGEAPGQEEDERGRPFVKQGKSGALIRSAFAKCGVSLDEDCWTTNALICRPPGNAIDDPKKVLHCRPNLIRAVRELKPKSILLFGQKAVKSLIGYLWREDVGSMSQWVRWKIPSQELNAWVCPNFHPSYVMRTKDSAVELWFSRYVEEALQLAGRPWKEVPDYAKQVEVILSSEQAAKRIDRLMASSKVAAFDFETNMLKPDSREGRIVCCAISNGKKTIAYPWHGVAIKATEKFLLSDVKKIGYNLKFEDRWVRAKLGFPVRNWVHDGMITAHALDHRKGITGLKFQSFVLLGQPSYNDRIEQFLDADESGGNSVNNVHKIAIADLLQYCGLDALLEYKVAIKQKEVLG